MGTRGKKIWKATTNVVKQDTYEIIMNIDITKEDTEDRNVGGIWPAEIEINYLRLEENVRSDENPEAIICAKQGWEWGENKALQWGTSSFYSSPYIVRMIKSSRLRWEGYVARTEQGRSAFKILTRIMKEWDLQEGLSVKKTKN